MLGVSPWLIIMLAVLAVILILVPIIYVKFIKKSTLDKVYFKKTWQEIYRLLGTGDGQSLSIIEADKLLDKALLDLKVKGKTLGERMVSAQNKFSNVDHVWRAHKLRNKMVHESGFKPKPVDIKDALLGFRTALKDLGAL
jgi:hypothetical protein